MLLTIQEFLKRRPDMEVHMESAIQSAINSSFILLDGECAGLISKVQSYMESGEIIDPNNEYYRNDFELSQLIEALTSQTQYSLNLGNDYSIGGGSYSIGNINSSYNRPEGRDIVAPGVYKLLSNARVYNLNVGIGVKQNQDHYLEGIDPADKHISISKAQADFVAKYQPNAAIGNVAYVNQSKIVDFAKPQDLEIGTYNTNRIAGGEGHRNNYYEIDNVPNIAFFGPNDAGTYSAISRGEVKEILNNNYLTKEQVFRVVYASGIEWNSRLNYEKNWITQFVVNGVLKWYLALENNTNKQPNLHPGIWKELTVQEIDLNLIQQQLEPFINQKVSQEVAQQILDTLNNLPTIEYVEETKDQVLFFNSEQDFTNFKNLTNTTDRDYETVPFQSQNDNAVTLNTTQTITSLKTFRAAPVGLKLQQAAGRSDKQYITFNDPNNTTTFSLGSQLTETSFEVNRGNLKIQTQEANKSVTFETSAVYFNRAVPQFGSEIKAGYGAGIVKFLPEDNSTKTLQFFNENPTDTRRFNLKINEPTEATNPTTKSYVDSQVNTLNQRITQSNNTVQNNFVNIRNYNNDKTEINNNINSNVEQINNLNTWRNEKDRELTTINNVLQNTTQNMVNTNTVQTISAEKTFSSLVTLTKTNGALAFKPGTNQPAYFEFYNGNTRIGYFGKGSSANNNMTLGAQSGKILLEASQGVEVPQPTSANNPATKQYVDNQVNTINPFLVQKRDYTFSQRNPEHINDDTTQYTFEITDLQETTVLGVNITFKDQTNSALKAKLWNVSFTTTWGPKVYVKVFMNWNQHLNYRPSEVNIDFSKFSIRVFYIPQYNTRIGE